MKLYIVSVLILFVVAGIFIGDGYGTEPMVKPPDRGGDPAAILLVKQGIKQFNEGEVNASRDSFELAVEIDPTLSSARFNARLAAEEMNQSAMAGGGVNTVGGGFAEFGLASLSGFIFVFVMAAYDIGVTPPLTGSKKKAFVERVPQKKEWAAAA
jgi:hypothetical protein